MKNSIKIMINGLIIINLLTGCGNKNNSSCNEETARLLGRVYYLSNPLSDHAEFVTFIQENASYFSRNGSAIKCATALGNRLIKLGLRSFNKEDYDHAYERTLEMGGSMEQARDVASSINQGAVDLFIMGKELVWLAKVLPSATEGDWNLFETSGTETRNQIRQVLPMYKIILEMDPSTAQMVNSVMKQFQPIAEKQVEMMVLMMSK